MDASWLHLTRVIAVICLPLLHVGAQDVNNPSADWKLADYYSDNKLQSNFTICNNESSSLRLLNEEKGLYGRPTYIYSPHAYTTYYSVYFTLYFVTPAEMVCLKDNNGSNNIPAYYLCLVAMNAYSKDPNQGQVIWTANPDKPVTNNACLLLNDSSLTLLDYHNDISSSPEIVWQSNTDAHNVSLVMSLEGNLVLVTNTSNPSYRLLWESFGNATDTLMVLQVLDNDRTLTVYSSSTATNSVNYKLAFANGSLVLYARIGRLIGDEESEYGSPYWVWPNPSVAAKENISFAVFCWDPVNQLRLYAGSNRPRDDSIEYHGMVSAEFCSITRNNNETSMQITGLLPSMNATYATFLRLEADGDLRAYTVDNTTYTYPEPNVFWRPFYSVFNSTPCHLPLYCGFYGMCVPPQRGDTSYCTCNYSHGTNDPDLVLEDPSDSKSGCKLANATVAQIWNPDNLNISSRQANTCSITDVQQPHACSSNDSGCEVKFLTINNAHYFSLDSAKSHPQVADSNGCQEECKRNRCCTAAFWEDSDHSCFLVLGRLGTIQLQQGSKTAFIKYVSFTRYHSNYIIWKVVGSVLGAVLLVSGILLVYLQRKRARKINELRKERLLLLSLLEGSNTERFTWKQMHEYTCGFSELLGGGGFGSVFRGPLPDGTAIAVKQLEEDRSQGQGDKEFIAEVSILSRIHHVHLVRLIGFCLEGSHRLLVYEYMENGSLDAWLFKSDDPSLRLLEADDKPQQQHRNNAKRMVRLPWKNRFQIAVGTAKGLAYLHEECEDRVIHMDLKPQNILLGRNFVAKISDFGMSRRTDREQTSVMTVMRGTPGYLATEWLLDCAITEKCDVYSFGIMLLEMVSGRKVKDLREVKQKLRMRPRRESVMLELLGESLRYDVEEKEAVRMVEVAMMCVRTDHTKRPAMSKVAAMLEGKEEVMREAADDDEDDAAEQLEMVRYPRARNRSLRVAQSFKVENRSFTDSVSSSSSSYIWNNYDDMSHNFNYNYNPEDRKKTMKKYFNIDHHHSERDRSSSSPSTEWDRLLQN